MVPSHQKASIFASIFHQIFMFFPNPLPEVIFRGTLRWSRPKKTIFDRLWDPLGPKIGPWSTIFRPKGSHKFWRIRPGALLEPTWSRFCAENAPRTHFHRSGVVFLNILEWFWKDFGSILDEMTMEISDGFWTIVEGFSIMLYNCDTFFLPRFRHQPFQYKGVFSSILNGFRFNFGRDMCEK